MVVSPILTSFEMACGSGESDFVRTRISLSLRLVHLDPRKKRSFGQRRVMGGGFLFETQGEWLLFVWSMSTVAAVYFVDT